MKKLTAGVTHQVADVASSSGLLLQRKCDCGNHTMGGECDDCAKKKSSLQRKAANGIESSAVPPIVHEVLRSPGQPLHAATRALMEPRFGYDFSHVRVHTDGKAAESARAVDALAYTVGQDIVFGTGQYMPATVEGRRLVGHELTHVLQQGRTGAPAGSQAGLEIGGARESAEQEAESVSRRVTDGQPVQVGRSASVNLQPARPGVIQRTPAPPTYGGATGTRDLSRIRIDAVPDFVASTLTAPRVVNAHLNDPSVVHMTWMLYDPSDNMMSGSFSTLPGRPNATTAPFSLEPSHFSGAGFVQGKYLLRCVGLNATHQPVVYADRDFNVLSASLTTNTALPTTYGELTFTQYDSADAAPPARPRYSVDVKLRFLPAATVTCREVGFIQTMQTIDDTGRSQQNTINPEQDARKTPLAWSVDRLAGTPTPFYGTEGTVGGAITMPPGKGAFGAGGPTPTPARLIDQASWNRVNNAKFETCVICRTGANRGQVYGCATWGYTANAANQVTLMPRGFRQMPSDQFQEARAAWNTWRTSVPAATRPEEAPALSSP